MTLRPLWVTNDLPPRAGGIQQFVENLLVRVEPATTLVLGPADPGAAEHDADAPYNVVRAHRGVWPTAATLAAVRRLARQHRPDVVVLGASWPLGQLAGALRRDPGVPVVALSHGLEAGLVTFGAGRLLRGTTRHLAAVTTISDYTEKRLRPHVPTRLVRVPPGVDPHVFHPGVDGQDLRRRWGVPPDALLVGCISRLVRRKGQDVLLDVWPTVAAAHPNAWLVVVGGGPLEPVLRRLADRAPRTVVAGPVAWGDLPAAYAACDVFAMPCRTRWGGLDVEGLGIVYLEAQACGVPVLGGQSGGAPEAIRDSTGVVVDGRDRAAVVAVLGRLLGDAALRRRMGAAGRAWVERDWAWPHLADRFGALLEEVADRGQRRLRGGPRRPQR